MKFYGLILKLHLPGIFCRRHANGHFPEIIKSCSGNPQTSKSIKSNFFFRNQYFLSTDAVESKKCFSKSEKYFHFRKRLVFLFEGTVRLIYLCVYKKYSYKDA